MLVLTQKNGKPIGINTNAIETIEPAGKAASNVFVRGRSKPVTVVTPFEDLTAAVVADDPMSLAKAALGGALKISEACYPPGTTIARVDGSQEDRVAHPSPAPADSPSGGTAAPTNATTDAPARKRSARML
jgi:hypothetical protein